MMTSRSRDELAHGSIDFRPITVLNLPPKDPNDDDDDEDEEDEEDEGEEEPAVSEPDK